MERNDILQSCYKILDISKEEMVEIFKLGDYELDEKRVHGYLEDKDSKEFLDCGYEALGSFLDGLIVYKRGPSDKKSSSEEEIRLNNNLVLKKLRVAFELKEVDLYAIFDAVDIDITKSELSSLFRKEGHKNYRACPDSILQLFLEGLEICEGRL